MRLRVMSIRFEPVAVSILLAVVSAGVAGCSKRAPAPVERTDAVPAAEQILQRMLATYRDAGSYSDQAVVRLKYREQGRWVEDEGSFAVTEFEN